MNKKEYMLKAIQFECYRYRAWVLQAFSVLLSPPVEDFPLKLNSEGKTYSFIDPESGELVNIEDSDTSKPLFTFREEVSLKAGEVINLKSNIVSTYGKLLANVIGLVYPLGSKIDYVNDEFNIRAVETEIEKRLTTDPEFQTKDSFKADDPIYVSEYLKFIDAILSLEGFSQLVVPSVTPKALTTDPNVKKVRKELIEANKDKLNDPTVVAKITDQLIEMDKAWIKGDLSEGFYNSGKDFDNVRKKMLLMQGYESGFGMKADTITTPLSEGWDIEKLPAMVNSLREGSYGRGKQTALGGYATKVVNRVFQNVRVTEEDCGTRLGWPKEIVSSNYKEFNGFYRLTEKGDKLLDADSAKALVGQTVLIRSPQFCKTKGDGFCRHCVGEPNAENETALAAHAAAVTSQLMNLMMKSMHNTALKTTTFDIDKSIF